MVGVSIPSTTTAMFTILGGERGRREGGVVVPPPRGAMLGTHRDDSGGGLGLSQFEATGGGDAEHGCGQTGRPGVASRRSLPPTHRVPGPARARPAPTPPTDVDIRRRHRQSPPGGGTVHDTP